MSIKIPLIFPPEMEEPLKVLCDEKVKAKIATIYKYKGKNVVLTFRVERHKRRYIGIFSLEVE